MSDEFVEIIKNDLPAPMKLNNYWLRDHCRCTKCYDFETAQRKQNLMDIPLNIKPIKYTITENTLTVKWSDDHESSYNIYELHDQQYETQVNKLLDSSVQLWDKKQIEGGANYARVTLNDYLCNEDMAKSIVTSLVDYGVAFIENVPANLQSTEVAVKRLFAPQKTFFGEMWSFTDSKDHADSAYSTSYLGAHTDNTYFNDAAGLLVLHCIQYSGTGGESLLVDGFKALNDLKVKHPDSYDRLCRVAVPGEYIEEKQHHTYSAPIIRLDPITGLPDQLRFNLLDRSYMNTIPQSEMLQFYKDLRNLTTEIQQPSNEWWFKLNPGTVMLFNNWRLLHGRASYTGRRKMAGCYVSHTEFLSVARTMGIIS